MPNVSGGDSSQPLASRNPGRRRQGFAGIYIVAIRKPLDLLDIENGVALHEGNRVLVLFALVVGFAGQKRTLSVSGRFAMAVNDTIGERASVEVSRLVGASGRYQQRLS